MTDQRHDLSEVLSGVRVLDGGLATELEYLGADISGPLWSAHVLEDEPEKVLTVHRAYIAAGADCITTSSYQVSRLGYEACGFAPQRADAALVAAVRLARQAADEAIGRRIVVAASLGPYGAALHNGAEYHGNYDCSFEELVGFHRGRMEILAQAPEDATPDLLAFETLPSLSEVRAIHQALTESSNLQAWLSFTCKDSRHVVHGERLQECAKFLDTIPQVVAIGINCTAPSLMQPLIQELRTATRKPVLVYPNSGERWDAEARCWTGSNDPAGFAEMAASWYAASAQIVGGCCRTRPAHIREVASVAPRD